MATRKLCPEANAQLAIDPGTGSMATRKLCPEANAQPHSSIMRGGRRGGAVGNCRIFHADGALQTPGSGRMNQIPGDEMGRIFRTLAIASFFLSVAALCTFEILSVDFGWHIKTGELIWATKSIPTHDVFSYIAEGRPWVDSHWLFQLMIFGVHAGAGIPGLYIMRVALLVATFAFLLSTNQRRQYLSVALFICLLALFTTYERFVMRPELASLCFLAAFFYCMENFSRRTLLCLVGIPLCQLIWTNMHGLSIVGIAFLALYVAGDVLQFLFTRSKSSFSDIRPNARELKLKFAVLGLAVLAYLANANGVEGILYPFKIFGELRGEVSSFPRLEELGSPFSANVVFPLDPIIIYKLFIGVSALSWIGHWRRVRFAHIIVYAAFFYLSTLAIRNMSLFAVVATPITVLNLSNLLDRVCASANAKFEMRRAVAATTAAAMVLIAAGIWTATSNNELYERLGWPRIFGVGLSDRFAGDVVEKLAALDGRFFNSPDLGGYLIWQLYPRKQVAVDGRWEIYGDRLPELKRAYARPEVFARMVEKYDIVAVVISTRTSLAKKMARWLRKSRDWHLTVNSKNVLLFERIDRIDR